MRNIDEDEATEDARPRQEMKELYSCLAQHDGRCWDNQIETDALSGKLDFLAKEAIADHNRYKNA